ncbi:type II toxin-antitoxin system PemK/MazF family toxin [Sulfurovum sp.]|uniref:type II toxin-antitoxin system PemK/MazF family toxin n=1 Tax=Sulfurovum sp. TaxID=1969726 RepID=UPI0025F5183A|nr:type II toxin-antitoxin system PemK/MazF family toxin [Sulfurovum sp.]
MMAFYRGDIHLVNFNPAKGGEIGKLRPAIIMSGSDENSILETCIVIPLSTTIVKEALPYRYTISQRDTLHKESDACINEIRALSKTRIKERVSALSEKELDIIQNSICELLL